MTKTIAQRELRNDNARVIDAVAARSYGPRSSLPSLNWAAPTALGSPTCLSRPRRMPIAYGSTPGTRWTSAGSVG